MTPILYLSSKIPASDWLNKLQIKKNWIVYRISNVVYANYLIFAVISQGRQKIPRANKVMDHYDNIFNVKGER